MFPGQHSVWYSPKKEDIILTYFPIIPRYTSFSSSYWSAVCLIPVQLHRGSPRGPGGRAVDESDYVRFCLVEGHEAPCDEWAEFLWLFEEAVGIYMWGYVRKGWQ